ncbi:helix-turn-helix domain-containing protein [Vibrio cholerae]|nr:helix-turn-helix domain-containing protein [Vibrio cholerae]
MKESLAMLYSASDIVREAMRITNLKQESFSKKLGVSQSQISKYLSGKSLPSAKTIMHCMNIIEKNSDNENVNTPYDILIRKVRNLNGDHSEEICRALLQVLTTYERLSGDTRK